MKKVIRYSLTAIITMIMCLIIAPSAFAEDTVYTTSDVTGGVRIDSVTTTETKLVIPDEIDGKVVVELAPKAFAGTAIKEITIPATVTSMYGKFAYNDYASALYALHSLEKVVFAEGMRTVPESALKYCVNVKEVVLPESLTTISDDAFFGCTALTTINLPDRIVLIGNEVFNGCSLLSEIDLPDGLVTLGSMVFANCTNIESIILPENLTSIGTATFVNTKISEIIIPASVTSMYTSYGPYNAWNSYSALDGMKYLTKVTFTDGMKTIPNHALYNATYVETVILPESISQISEKAFLYCSSLKNINIPNGVTTIGNEAFNGCSSLATIELPDNLATLGSMAFANCSRLNEIILPDNLTTMGTATFAGTKISELVIPATVISMYGWYSGYDSWYSFSALDKMEYLTKVTFADGMKTIPSYALYNATYVETVILPESISQISEKAFLYCSSLKNINIPNGVTTIGNEAFNGCSSLATIELPDNLATLGSMAFANCSRLNEIILPDNLTTMGTATFAGTKISELVIPATVISMYGWYSGYDSWYSFSALDKMEYLTKVTFADGMKAVPENALLGCNYIEEVVIYDCNTSLDAMKIAAEENDYILTVLPCESCKKYLIGDVNGDGRITAVDARIVLRISAQLEKVENYDMPFEVFDIIRDERITAADARKILRISAQLE